MLGYKLNNIPSRYQPTGNTKIDENFKPNFIRYTTNNWSDYFSFSGKILKLNFGIGYNSILFVAVVCTNISNSAIIISTSANSYVLLSDNLDSYNLLVPWVSGATLTFTTNITSFRSGFKLN